MVFTCHTRYDLYAQPYLPIIPEKIRDRFLQAYLPPFCEAMRLVISPSEGMAEILRGMGVRGPVEVIPNGVELQLFLTAQPLRRADFGLSAEDVILVYAGRLATEKNLPMLLQAFAEVARAVANTYLLIIGGGQKRMETELQSLISELGLRNRVRLTGMVPYEVVPSYLVMGDVFVTASVTEVHPLSVIEGMAAGLPLIGIRSPGISDTVEDGQTGVLGSNNPAVF